MTRPQRDCGGVYQKVALYASDLLPDFRTKLSMICAKEGGRGYVEEQTHGRADDRGSARGGIRPDCEEHSEFLQVIDELDSMGIEFISRRENVDTSGPMGRLFVTIISAIAELERSLVADRVRSGMRRAKLEGRQIGRARLDVNREQIVHDRRSGMSLTQVAKRHNISRASVCRLMKEANSDCNLAIAIPSWEVGLEARP
jgi:hypothetical protein